MESVEKTVESTPTIIKGYKAFDKNLQCRDYQYEVGKEYVHTGRLVLCGGGFHFCRVLKNCFNYYPYNKETTRVCEIEAFGKVVGDADDKEATSKIRIVRELSWDDVVTKYNQGYHNCGTANNGRYNHGSHNQGERNVGDHNDGVGNIGCANYGNGNVGKHNIGNWNNGSFNIGCWNIGKRNNGFFNTRNNNEYRPRNLYMFDKLALESELDGKPFCYFFTDLVLAQWVEGDAMTEQEKKDHPTWSEVGGYVKTFDYKEAWRAAFFRAKDRDDWGKEKERLLGLPNFNFKIFEKITGISENDIMG